MAKASIHVTKTRTITRSKIKVPKNGNRKGGNSKKCPVCGKFMGISMDKKNAETRTKLKDISSVKEFGDLMEQTMLSEEEKKILWMHYKEKKTLQCIADEIGLSEIAVKKKHRKMLMKIGRMI